MSLSNPTKTMGTIRFILLFELAFSLLLCVKANSKEQINYDPEIKVWDIVALKTIKVPHPRPFSLYSASWSQDGSTIVMEGSVGPCHYISKRKIFSCEEYKSRIYLINKDGTGFTEIKRLSKDIILGTALFPNGKGIAYSNERGMLCLFSIETFNEKCIIKNAFSPSWSPDGKQLIFENGRGICLINKDGTSLRPVIDSVLEAFWLPGGKTIIYQSSAKEKYKWFLLDIQTLKTVELPLPDENSNYNHPLSFEILGESIAWVERKHNDYSYYALINLLNLGNLTIKRLQLEHLFTQSMVGCFSPDGSKAAILDNESGLKIMDLYSQKMQQITSGRAVFDYKEGYHFCRWSPTGDAIVYWVMGDGNYEYFEVDAPDDQMIITTLAAQKNIYVVNLGILNGLSEGDKLIIYKSMKVNPFTSEVMGPDENALKGKCKVINVFDTYAYCEKDSGQVAKFEKGWIVSTADGKIGKIIDIKKIKLNF